MELMNVRFDFETIDPAQPLVRITNTRKEIPRGAARPANLVAEPASPRTRTAVINAATMQVPAYAGVVVSEADVGSPRTAIA